VAPQAGGDRKVGSGSLRCAPAFTGLGGGVLCESKFSFRLLSRATPQFLKQTHDLIPAVLVIREIGSN